MNKGFMGAVCFVLGGIAGYFTANKLLKDKYEQQVQEEVDSVKAAFRKTHPVVKKKAKATEKERRQYSNTIHNAGYSEKTKPEPVQRPYVIAPEEYDNLGYDTISLTYYADGTLCDDNDRPIDEEEIETTVGADFSEHFGQYEDDSVFVRNDRLKADYEILMDERTYADILKAKPYLKL